MELKNERFNMLLSPTELRMMRALAESQGCSLADVVRQLVRRAYQDTFEHGQLRNRAFSLLTPFSPLKPTDFVAQLGQFFPFEYLSFNINRVLDRLCAEGFATGDHISGYRVTAAGIAARGF